MSAVTKSKLPRLAREFYRGRAAVLWTHTIADRKTGWLNERFHHLFRETLLHACHRHSLLAPCYVLMPDHWHLVWMGISAGSDQWLATAFLRKHLQPALVPVKLQDRAHDHVLRERERARGAFAAACAYVRQNPERASLCSDWRQWPYAGAIIPGYPDLDPRHIDFWETYWRIHNRLLEFPALTRRATTRDHSDRSSPLREERDQPALDQP